MAFSPKKIVFGVMFLLGILLGYNICSQYSSISLSVETTAENDSSSSCFDFNSEVYEEDQIVCETEFVAVAEVYTQHQYLLITCQSSRPFFSVWQPPKLS